MNITDMQERFKVLVTKKEALSKEKIQLDTKITICEKDIEEKLKELETTYGVKTFEEAKVLLDSLESEISTEMSECEEFLKKFD